MSGRMTEICFSGEFAIWSYTIGHGSLLLRRTKSGSHPTRVDVLLKDVSWVCMPTTFIDLQLRQLDAEEGRKLLTKSGGSHEAHRKVFMLSGKDWSGYVQAGAVAVHEDDGEYNDPSPLVE
jgi:hypothetical protein